MFNPPFNQDFDFTINKLIEDHSRAFAAVPSYFSNVNVNSSGSPKRRKRPDEDRDKYLIFVCGKCGADFKDDFQYEQHLVSIHNNVNSIKDVNMLALSTTEAECQICGVIVKYKMIRDLQMHYFSHLGYKSFKCACHGYHFHDKVAVNAHIAYRRRREKINTNCIDGENSCNTSASRILDDGHEFMPTSPETGIGYMCPECGDNFLGEEPWKQHCNDIHEFKTMEGLNMSRIDGGAARCNQCGVVISGKWDNYKMRRHKLTHSPFKAFYCRLCKYTRKRKDDVLCHIRQTHGTIPHIKVEMDDSVQEYST